MNILKNLDLTIFKVVMAVGRECKSEELKMKNEELRDKRCKSGYKMTELGEIPEDWEVRKLGDICDVRKEKFNPIGAENAKYIALEHIEQGTGRINGIGNSDETTSIKAKFKKGDILFGKLRPYLKKIWLADFNGVCATEILPLFVKYNYNSKFCFYVIQQDKFIEYTNQSSFGTKMPRTSWNYMREFVLSIPPLKEQQKIASILSSVDEQIEITDSLIEKTKELKKGLMQRLLTKGIGHSKFKDTEIGRIPVEWEVVQIKEIVKVGPQNGIYKNNKYYCGNKFNIVALKDLYRNYKFINLDELQFIDLNDNEIKLYGLKQGDILINRVSKAVDGVGRMRIVGQLKNIICFESNMMRITLESSKANTEYIYYLSEGDMFRNEIMKVAKDSNQSSISQSDISNIKIALPSIEEQTQIAKILSSVDEQIDQYESKKEKLKELKKGLMQKLLTGKIRVKV
jgi:type I restriction enzyme, S subunit